MASLVLIGVRVVRGPDWSWEVEDGGEGNVGTVVDAEETSCDEETVATVFVYWDNGVWSNYRCGFRGKFDLRSFDNAQTGVSHPMVTCDGCSTSPVYGMKWKCVTCYDYDLCTECYMSNKHSLEHRFVRHDTPRSEGVPVPARSGGRRVKAKGFFKGAVVSRGIDWKWGDQDGGESDGSTGVLKEIKGWCHESFRSIAEVQWGSSDTSNIYRVGHKGKVDLKCDTPGDGGEYYPDHLPMSGGSTLSVHDESVATPLASTSVTTLGINSTALSNTTAKGTGLNASQNILNMSNYSVSDSQSKRSIHEDLGFHVYQRGDVVRVIDDLAKVHQIQGPEEWNDDMALTLGQLGQVMDVAASGDCIVKVNGFFWVYNPKALVPAPGETPDVIPVHDHPTLALEAASAGDPNTLKAFLSQKPEAVDLVIQDRTALYIAASHNYVECVKVLLEYHATVNIQDSNGLTPLHWACHHGNTEVIKLLLKAGADPAKKDGNGTNCLHKCIHKGCLKGCKLILRHYPELLNVPNVLESQPLHIACIKGRYSIVKFLLEQEKCDINAVTRGIHTALHLAVDEGNAAIVELLVGHGIDLDVIEERGITALHIVLAGKPIVSIPEDSSELSKICSTLSNLPRPMIASAAVACLLVREGADLYFKETYGKSPLEFCSGELASHLLAYARQRSTFHGSLRRSPKPTPAALVEEKDTRNPQKTAEESSKSTDERRLVEEQQRDVTAVVHNDRAKPTKKPIVLTTNNLLFNSAPSSHVEQMKHTQTTEKLCSASQDTNKESPRNMTSTAVPVSTSESAPSTEPDNDEACLLCDRPVDVRIEPCGHTVLCRSHANTAERCPQCRGPIHCIADLEPLCGMCQENVCSVTLKPCDHMICSGCALRMKRCFECKTKITSKEGLQDSSQSPAVKSESDPTSIATTDSSVSISDESLLCEICVSNKKNTAFTCGHQLCYDCSLKVDKCPICGEEIQHRVILR